VEYTFDALLRHVELRAELIATAEWRLIVECYLGYDKIISCSTHLCKAESDGEKKLVSCMLQIMLVVGIVDDALEVALIVTHLHE
jgi:hypothetical protein